jgi:hypothetical protein
MSAPSGRTRPSTFNLTVFREAVDAFGKIGVEVHEQFTSLSMNPQDGRFVESLVDGQSSLVDVQVDPYIATNIPPFQGYSLSLLLVRALIIWEMVGVGMLWSGLCMEAEDYEPYYSKYTRRWDLVPIMPKSH